MSRLGSAQEEQRREEKEKEQTKEESLVHVHEQVIDIRAGGDRRPQED